MIHTNSMIFTDHPIPQIEISCIYSDSNPLTAVYKMSWYVDGSVLNYRFNDHIYYWENYIECRYPNGTKVGQSQAVLKQ